MNTRKLIGIAVVCFGAGVFLSFLLPGRFLAFIEAAAIITAGVLLIKRR